MPISIKVEGKKAELKRASELTFGEFCDAFDNGKDISLHNLIRYQFPQYADFNIDGVPASVISSLIEIETKLDKTLEKKLSRIPIVVGSTYSAHLYQTANKELKIEGLRLGLWLYIYNLPLANNNDTLTPRVNESDVTDRYLQAIDDKVEKHLRQAVFFLKRYTASTITFQMKCSLLIVMLRGLRQALYQILKQKIMRARLRLGGWQRQHEKQLKA